MDDKMESNKAKGAPRVRHILGMFGVCLVAAGAALGVIASTEDRKEPQGPTKPATFQECVDLGECASPQQLAELKNFRVVKSYYDGDYLVTEFSDGTREHYFIATKSRRDG